MVHIDGDLELFEGLRHVIEPGGGAMLGIPAAVELILHLPLHIDLVELGGHGGQPLGDDALVADQPLGASLEDGRAVFFNNKGFDFCPVEDGLVEIFAHAEELVVEVKDDLGVECAEVDLLGDDELSLEGLILLPEGAVLAELLQGHVPFALLDVHHAVAVIADILAVDLPGEQPLDLAAADGAGILFCK